MTLPTSGCLPMFVFLAVSSNIALHVAELVCSGTKVVVGTQIGVLSIFNRNSGWGDCVDRVPGYVLSLHYSDNNFIQLEPRHPHSVDALCSLPSSVPNADTSCTILTGSSDGLVRAVKVLPTKLLGVVADHGELPVERIEIGGGSGGQLDLEPPNKRDGGEEDECQIEVHSRWWVGSVGHDEVLRLTNLEAFLREGEARSAETMEIGADDHIDDDVDSEAEVAVTDTPVGRVTAEKNVESGEDSEAPRVKKRKHKPEKHPLKMKKKGKNSVEADGMFFSGL